MPVVSWRDGPSATVARMRGVWILVPGALIAAACAGGDDEGSSGADACAATSAATATPGSPPTVPTPTITSAASVPTTPERDGAAATTSHPTRRYDFSAVDPIVQRFIDARGLNGASLVVVDRDDGIVHEQYWGDFDRDRISFIASSSKMVTAGVLLHLDDGGLLDVDAPVADAVGWGSGNPDITPAQLVSNSSGLVELLPDVGYRPYHCQFLAVGTLQACAERIFTTPDDDPDVVPPDSEFRYGGGQWQVAGGVAEAVSGKSWAELIDAIYIEPCGLTSFGYNNHFSQFPSEEPFAYPHEFDGELAQLEPTDNPNMEGGAYSNAVDYAGLLLMHLRDGVCGDTQVLSTEALARMHSDRIGPAYDGTTPLGGGYGMGWWVDRTTGIISDAGAYGAVPWLDVDAGYGAVLIVESDGGSGGALGFELIPTIVEAMTASRAGR